MSEAPVCEWCFYLDDMIEFGERVLTYTEGLDQACFEVSGRFKNSRPS